MVTILSATYPKDLKKPRFFNGALPSFGTIAQWLTKRL
jgi:hypothetical protein